MLKARIRTRLLPLMAAGMLAACSGEFGPPVPISDASVGDARARGDLDEAGSENPINPHATSAKDASSEPFFINDPAPPMCGPDGGMSAPASVGGTAECPADKNREGCLCPEVGKKEACWPGRRENRNHGICKDGVTTCQANVEFIQAWGPCLGYVLPKDGATQGADACQCFSNGQWAIANLVPCINSDGPYIYSSHQDAEHGFACDAVSMTPPPAPMAPWTKSTLNVECAGQYQLCYAIKAGKANDPKASDCTVMRKCIDVWYDKAGKTQDLPALPGWAASDQDCSKRFVESGGYGEMSVKGKSAECDAVDDGKGAALVFRRTSYCPSDCGDHPDADGCKDCAVMGSGSF